MTFRSERSANLAMARELKHDEGLARWSSKQVPAKPRSTPLFDEYKKAKLGLGEKLFNLTIYCWTAGWTGYMASAVVHALRHGG